MNKASYNNFTILVAKIMEMMAILDRDTVVKASHGFWFRIEVVLEENCVFIE
jgi:hypothetical protein